MGAAPHVFKTLRAHFNRDDAHFLSVFLFLRAEDLRPFIKGGSVMLRVLQAVTCMDRGGLETMLMNYYRHIDRTRVQFDFLTHRAREGAYDKEI